MAALTFTALHDLYLDGEHFEAGEYEIEDASPELRRLVAHADAAQAGAVEVHDGGDYSGVQKQEDGEAAYADAVESGDWQIGQDIQASIDAEAKAEIEEIGHADIANLTEVVGGEE